MMGEKFYLVMRLIRWEDVRLENPLWKNIPLKVEKHEAGYLAVYDDYTMALKDAGKANLIKEIEIDE